MFYDSQYAVIKKHHIRMGMTTTRMLRWMSDNILRVRIRNECIRNKLEVILIEDKTEERVKMDWTCAMRLFCTSVRIIDTIIVYKVRRSCDRPNEHGME